MSFSLQLISCLSTLLLNQDPSIWSYSSTMQIFHCMLTFSVHPRPKVNPLLTVHVSLHHFCLISLLCLNLEVPRENIQQPARPSPEKSITHFHIHFFNILFVVLLEITDEQQVRTKILQKLMLQIFKSLSRENRTFFEREDARYELQ